MPQQQQFARNRSRTLLLISLLAAGFLLMNTDSIPNTTHAQSLNARWINTKSEQSTFGTLTRLYNGKVLATGIRFGDADQPRRATLYDPLTDTFTETGQLNFARTSHSAILLRDGRVLVVGGSRDEPGVPTPLPVPQPEIFDPAAGTWSEVQVSTTVTEITNLWLRSNFQYLPNGNVLILSQIYNRAFLFNPLTGALRETNKPNTAIGGLFPSSIILGVGKVLFVSNESISTITPAAEIFDSESEAWSIANLPESIMAGVPKRLPSLLPDGRALGLFVSSSGQRISSLFDPLTGIWSGPTTRFADFPNTVALSGGEVLAFRDNVAEIYSQLTREWRTISTPTKTSPGAVLLADGRVYTGKELYGIDFGSTLPSTPAVNTSAASFRVEPIAKGAIAAIFGTNLGNTITIRDRNGVTHPVNTIFSGASTTQINYLLPNNIFPGQAEMTISGGGQTEQRALFSIADISPGIFTANATGSGVPAAVILRVKADSSQTFEPLLTFDSATSRFVPTPIDLGANDESVFLILFGTGIKNRTSLENSLAYIGGTKAAVQFAGAQGSLLGLEQLNIQISRSLAGRGDVDILLTIDGKSANTTSIKVK